MAHTLKATAESLVCVGCVTVLTLGCELSNAAKAAESVVPGLCVGLGGTCAPRPFNGHVYGAIFVIQRGSYDDISSSAIGRTTPSEISTYGRDIMFEQKAIDILLNLQ